MKGQETGSVGAGEQGCLCRVGCRVTGIVPFYPSSHLKCRLKSNIHSTSIDQALSVWKALGQCDKGTALSPRQSLTLCCLHFSEREDLHRQNGVWRRGWAECLRVLGTKQPTGTANRCGLLAEAILRNPLGGRGWSRS